ncbi:MAG: hypothetical protein RID07_13765, partial [Lacipirellulaceae bacterium]
MPAQLTEDLITDELGFDQSIEPGVIDRLHRQMSRLTEDVAHLIEGEVASVDGDSEKTESSDEITARRQLISFVIP